MPAVRGPEAVVVPMPALIEPEVGLLSMPALHEQGAELLSMPARPCFSKEWGYSQCLRSAWAGS